MVPLNASALTTAVPPIASKVAIYSFVYTKHLLKKSSLAQRFDVIFQHICHYQPVVQLSIVLDSIAKNRAPSALSEKFTIPVSQAASIAESCKSFFGLYFVVIVALLYT